MTEVKCKYCGGRGRSTTELCYTEIDLGPCGNCRGTGKVPEKVELWDHLKETADDLVG